MTDRVRARERRAQRVVAACFLATMAAAGGLLVLYVAGGQTQLEGVLLFVALGALGVGIVVWSHDLVNARVVVEERGTLGGDKAELAEFQEALAEEAGFSRRTLLIRLLTGAIAGLGAALAIPVLSLGPAPGRTLFETAWRRGTRLVDPNGALVVADDVPVGGVVTVFPEGAGQPADSATVLVRVDPALLQLSPGQAAGAPDGYVAYSKLCTHVGCPVGLYVAEEHRLLCPCHQSEFDVLTGATPVAGPAGRALPQLPIQLQPDGTFVAMDDFSAPVGPSFWNMTHE